MQPTKNRNLSPAFVWQIIFLQTKLTFCGRKKLWGRIKMWDGRRRLWVGGRKCGRKLWWEEVFVGGKSRGRTFFLPTKPSSPPILLPHQTILPQNLPPTPHSSPLTHFFPPTNEENHKKFTHKIGSHPTKQRKGLHWTLSTEHCVKNHLLKKKQLATYIPYSL